MGDLLSQILRVLIQILDKTADLPLGNYAASESDIAGAIKYFGSIDKYGRWYILKNDSGTGTFRYTSGSENFQASWAIRATLSYDTYDKVFI